MRGMYKLEQEFDFFGSHYRLTVLAPKAWSPRIVPQQFKDRESAVAWMRDHLPLYVEESIPYFNSLVKNLQSLPRPQAPCEPDG